MINIEKVLLQLNLKDKKGRYDNHFYIINLNDDIEYAKMYSELDAIAINTEVPSIEVDSNKNISKIINYFETTVENTSYNIFLIANFNENNYYIKIGEQ